MNLSAADEAGYALLDKYILSFKQMAEEGTGGIEKVENALEGMMAEAKKDKAQGLIDPVFFNRYRRLLMITKLAIIEDPEGILSPLIEREISEFIEDITGEKLNMGGKGGIGAMAGALAEEVINLHMYLDNKKNREKLMEELKKKITKEKK